VKSGIGWVLIALALLVNRRPALASGASWEQAGGLLAGGKNGAAAEAARPCAGEDGRCALVLARSLFLSGQPGEAAAALAPWLVPEGKLLALEPHALALLGEARLMAAEPHQALEPLRAAARLDAQGPAGTRAAGLLARALFADGDFPGAAQQALHAATLPGQSPEEKAQLARLHAQALLSQARTDPALVREAALALRALWLQHPELPEAQNARDDERALGVSLPPPTGHELLLRASRLLSAGRPGAAAAQAEVAAAALTGEDAAEAQLLHARSLAADGRRNEAGPSLLLAAKGAPHVAAQASMLLARDRARHGRDAEAIRIADDLVRRFPSAPEAEEAVLFSARLELDAGRKPAARARLARLAAQRRGPNAAAARWTLAWRSYEDRLPDAVERFAEFSASAQTDEERAQGAYWQARAGKPELEGPLFRRAAALDPLGWYGLLARDRLGQAFADPAPFPPAPLPRRSTPLPPRLALADELARMGFLADAAAEADRFVQEHGDAVEALPVYERAHRFDRSVTLGDSLLGARSKLPQLDALTPRLRTALAAAYPAAFPAEVAASTRRTGIDPYLLLAVMRRESLFKADARSAAGAVGLMQLLPATARRAALVLGRPPLTDQDLTVPATAIDLGAWYLAELLGRFGDAPLATAAYNAGPRIAAPWADKGAGEAIDRWVEEIPYRETRKYIKVVIGAWSAYRILAGGSPPRLLDTVPALRPGAAF
jgi:soluble lytic murein transglycosylase